MSVSSLPKRYQNAQLIARGGCGAVYRAVDQRTGRPVAVKQVSIAAVDPALAQALRREAQTLQRLEHPRLPAFVEYLQAESDHFLVMAYVDGDDLARQLARRTTPFPVGQVMAWADQLLDVLAYLHGRQPPVIHRDIKPANLKLDGQGRVILLDFGLARGAATSLHSLPGYTLIYAAPEQIRGEATAPASDLYSLAATLYHLLTGVKPADALRREAARVDGQPDPLRPAHELNPLVPPALADVLGQALALDPARRFAAAAEMQAALRRAVEEPETRLAVRLAGARPAPHNLPVALTPLIGREREAAAVQALLRRDDVRLVTLTGPGGVGKTRLALAAARRAVEHFPDGVFWVSLEMLPGPDLVLQAVAGALDVAESAGRPLAEAVMARLGQGAVLLALDNFEHLLPAAGLLCDLLAACPRLKLLVTSRERLRLAAEHEFAVPPLALAAVGPDSTPAEIGRAAAVALFVQRAQSALPGFVLNGQNAAAVAELCRRLDGLPLAIELAAARSRVLAPQDMLARLDDRFAWLRSRSADRGERHRALQAALDWSYDLLTEAERRLFCRLAVFNGGCTLAAAEAVAGETGVAATAVLDGLEALLDHSLLRRGEGPEGEPRFVMLESIHRYAAGRLAECDDGDAVRRHAGYFAALAEAAAPHLRGPEQGRWLARLTADHANLRAALAWLLGDGQPAQALELAAALARFWWLRGHLSEGRRWLAQALDAAAGEADPALRARALGGAGALARDLGDYEQARGWYQEELQLARRLGDPTALAAALNDLGSLAVYQEDYPAARPLFEESLALRRQAGDTLGLAGSLNNLGMVALHLGDYGGAEALSRESLALYRRQGDGWGEALALNNLAFAAYKQADLAAARASFAESLALFQQLEDPEGIATVIEALAWIALAAGELERAARLAAAADQQRRTLGTGLYGLDLAEHEAMLAALRGQLGAAGFLTAWQAGAALTSAETAALALGEGGRLHA